MPATKTEVENPVLHELINWVSALKTVGVSPDKAVEVARDFFLASCLGGEEEGEEWDYDKDGEEE